MLDKEKAEKVTEPLSTAHIVDILEQRSILVRATSEASVKVLSM